MPAKRSVPSSWRRAQSRHVAAEARDDAISAAVLHLGLLCRGEVAPLTRPAPHQRRGGHRGLRDRRRRHRPGLGVAPRGGGCGGWGRVGRQETTGGGRCARQPASATARPSPRLREAPTRRTAPGHRRVAEYQERERRRDVGWAARGLRLRGTGDGATRAMFVARTCSRSGSARRLSRLREATVPWRPPAPWRPRSRAWPVPRRAVGCLPWRSAGRRRPVHRGGVAGRARRYVAARTSGLGSAICEIIPPAVGGKEGGERCPASDLVALPISNWRRRPRVAFCLGR